MVEIDVALAAARAALTRTAVMIDEHREIASADHRCGGRTTPERDSTTSGAGRNQTASSRHFRERFSAPC
jgi:hypothetical protein